MPSWNQTEKYVFSIHTYEICRDSYLVRVMQVQQLQRMETKASSVTLHQFFEISGHVGMLKKIF